MACFNKKQFLSLLCFLNPLLLAPILAAPADFDYAFGDAGKVVMPVGTGNAQGIAAALQSDGKILVAGHALNGSTYDVALARFTTDGVLDTSFDGDGLVMTAIGSSADQAMAVAIQTDGKIVLAGTSYNGSNFDFAVVRYTKAGALDTTFSGDGKATAAIGSGDDVAWAVAVQSDGKIVVAGRSHNGSNQDIALARFTSAGVLDTTFSSDGKLTTAVGAGDDVAYGVVVQGDGKMVAAGYSANATDSEMALVRYTAAGALDTSFSGDGKLTVAAGGGNNVATAVALQSDGKIVVAGDITAGTQRDFAVVRCTAAGALDTAFGGDGIATLDISNGDDLAQAIALKDGNILVAGASHNGGSYDFSLARFTASGEPDYAFSSTGTARVSLQDGDDMALGVMVQADGKIVQAGYSTAGGVESFALTRFAGGARSGSELTVKGNGIAIQATSPVSVQDGTDYGPVAVGGAGLQRSFVLQNTGPEALDLTGSPAVHLSGPMAAEFSVTQPSVTVLQPGQTTSFEVTFSPSTEGLKEIAVGVDNNGPLSPFYFFVAGAGAMPPTLVDAASTGVTMTSATLGARVSSDGFLPVTERGFVYALTAENADPQIGGAGVVQLPVAGTTGSFSTVLGGLAVGTSYTFRAYAMNSLGTSYSAAAPFSTAPQPEAGVVDVVLGAAFENGLVAQGCSPAGQTIRFTLNFAPQPGAVLTVVKNTALTFINGAFANLTHGQRLSLEYNGKSYSFIVNYYGGSGNDLVLQPQGLVPHLWRDTRFNPADFSLPFSAVAAGNGYSLALRADGTVVAWGTNGSGQATPPAGLADVRAIAAGHRHCLALKADGSVVGWGLNDNGEANPPAGLEGVASIAAGQQHSVAVKQDGSVVAWGNNDQGETNVPAGLGGVIAAAAGLSHTVALRADGTVVAWGSNSQGQTTVPAGLQGVVAVCADYDYTLALKQDGTVVAWGNPGGPVPAGLADVASISAMGGNFAALKRDGSVVMWGGGQSQTVTALAGSTALSCGSHILALQPGGVLTAWAPSSNGGNTYGQALAPEKFGNVISVTAGGYHVVTAEIDGSVAAWGDVNGWQYHQHEVPAGLSGVVRVSAGFYHTLALKTNGTVVSWGSNSDGQRGVPGGLSNVAAVAAGHYHSLALKTDGTVVGWGRNTNGQRSIPADLNDVTAIAAGEAHSLALKGDGTVVAWGRNTEGQATVPATLSNVVAIAAGAHSSAALMASGTIISWGGSAGQTSTFSGFADAREIAVGYGGVLVLRADGSLTTAANPGLLVGPQQAGAIVSGYSNTVALAPLPPAVGLLEADTNGAIQTTINPHGQPTAVRLDYGPTGAYGTTRALVLSSPDAVDYQVVTSALTGLTPGAAYRYRLTATSTVGATVSTGTFVLPTALQSWRQLHFGTSSNSSSAADHADFDGDGLSNILEFACHLNPTASSSSPVTSAVTPTHFEFIFRRSVAAVNDGTQFVVEWNDSMAAAAWSSAGVSYQVVGGDSAVQTVKALVPLGSGGRRFVRLTVLPSL